MARIAGKKGQEEMIGFVLIIVLVAVISLVFLAISIKPKEMSKSKEVESFLHSSLLYTTSCQPSSVEFYNFKDLIASCFKNEKCLNEEKACDVLNKTAIKLVENSFSVGEEKKYKAYQFSIYEKDNILFSLAKGSPSKSSIGSEAIFDVSGINLVARLQLYY